MSVNTTSAFGWLVSGVQSYFVANAVTAAVHQGWQARYRILNQGQGQANRVVFTPADENGAAGTMLPPRRVGQQHIGATDSIRVLADWEQLVIVWIWAVAPPSTGDEEAREIATYEAVDTLHQWTTRALYATAHADIVFGNVGFVPPGERAYGLEKRVELTLRSPQFDVSDDLVQPMPHVSKKLGSTT